ncbi:MAG: hypothetical protein ACOYJF_06320 [Prevotella sp.]|jgi:hypothetical protein
MKFKLHLDWKKLVVYIFVSAGLLYITESAAMSAGILLLLLLGDRLLADREFNKNWKKEHAAEIQELEEELRRKAKEAAEQQKKTGKSTKKIRD